MSCLYFVVVVVGKKGGVGEGFTYTGGGVVCCDYCSLCVLVFDCYCELSGGVLVGSCWIIVCCFYVVCSRVCVFVVE